MQTEGTGRINILCSNALAFFIVLVCKLRFSDAPKITKKQFTSDWTEIDRLAIEYSPSPSQMNLRLS